MKSWRQCRQSQHLRRQTRADTRHSRFRLPASRGRRRLSMSVLRRCPRQRAQSTVAPVMHHRGSPASTSQVWRNPPNCPRSCGSPSWAPGAACCSSKVRRTASTCRCTTPSFPSCRSRPAGIASTSSGPCAVYAPPRTDTMSRPTASSIGTTSTTRRSTNSQRRASSRWPCGPSSRCTTAPTPCRPSRDTKRTPWVSTPRIWPGPRSGMPSPRLRRRRSSSGWPPVGASDA